MVPRRTRGAERGARALQWSSEIIFEVLRKHEPDHPLLVEAYAEATLRFLDLPRALGFLEAINPEVGAASRLDVSTESRREAVPTKPGSMASRKLSARGRSRKRKVASE